MLQTNKGFTIIEVLVMISALIIISLVAFSFMSVTLLNSNKALAVKEVRQNGNYALSVIERLVLSAKTVDCAGNMLDIDTVTNENMLLYCTEDFRIASSSAHEPNTEIITYLTNNKVNVKDCIFTCPATEGISPVVSVKFTVDTGNADSRASEKSSMIFENKFVVRNQLY